MATVRTGHLGGALLLDPAPGLGRVLPGKPLAFLRLSAFTAEMGGAHGDRAGRGLSGRLS